MPCPKCRSARLKPADPPVAGELTGVAATQRRYTCSECGWTGWRQRRERRRSRWPSLRPTGPMSVAYVLFAVVLLFFLVLEVLFMRSCSEAMPSDPTQGLARSQG